MPDRCGVWISWKPRRKSGGRVIPGAKFGEWLELGDRYTTQKPAVLCIGPGGRKPGEDRVVWFTTPAMAQGQGGFGAVFGSKKLKADQRHRDGKRPGSQSEGADGCQAVVPAVSVRRGSSPGWRNVGCFCWSPVGQSRRRQFFKQAPSVRTGTSPGLCRLSESVPQRLTSGISNESTCGETMWGMDIRRLEKTKRSHVIWCRLYGINASQMGTMVNYLYALYKQGILGPGKEDRL